MFLIAKTKDWRNEQLAKSKAWVDEQRTKFEDWQIKQDKKRINKAQGHIDAIHQSRDTRKQPQQKNSEGSPIEQQTARDTEQSGETPAEQPDTGMNGGGDSQPPTEGKPLRKRSKPAIAGSIIGGLALALMFISGAFEYRIGYAVDPNIEA